jgi:pilus assembly protein Flp/PilA
MKETKMLASPKVVLLRRYLSDESGATAIEYGLMAAGIGGTIAATVWGLGKDVKTVLWDKLANLF